MNIIFDIGIYVLASSLIMVGYVWFKYFKHSQLELEQMPDTANATGEGQAAKENIAA